MNAILTNKRDLINLLDSLLVPHGFVRTKDNWYLDNKECISIIGLGKSFYGGQFSLGIDVLLKELRPDLLPFPPRHLCHFRGYGVEALTTDREGLKAALNLENSESSADRISTITRDVTQFALPFIMPLNSKQSIAHEYRVNQDFELYCKAELKLALEREGYLSEEELKFDL